MLDYSYSFTYKKPFNISAYRLKYHLLAAALPFDVQIGVWLYVKVWADALPPTGPYMTDRPLFYVPELLRDRL